MSDDVSIDIMRSLRGTGANVLPPTSSCKRALQAAAKAEGRAVGRAPPNASTYFDLSPFSFKLLMAHRSSKLCLELLKLLGSELDDPNRHEVILGKFDRYCFFFFKYFRSLIFFLYKRLFIFYIYWILLTSSSLFSSLFFFLSLYPHSFSFL